MLQSGVFLFSILTIGLLLMKNVLRLLAKSPLQTLGLTAAAPGRDKRIHKKFLNLEILKSMVREQQT